MNGINIVIISMVSIITIIINTRLLDHLDGRQHKEPGADPEVHAREGDPNK